MNLGGDACTDLLFSTGRTAIGEEIEWQS